MQQKLMEILACPKCHSQLLCDVEIKDDDGEIVKGKLRCLECHNDYPIESGIPRFVEHDNYASSFGYQWNRFRAEQIDSFNGTTLSEKRLFSETNWTKEWMAGKWMLDAGCGAGRFLDAASQADGDVVGVDISNAVDAAKANLAGRKNIHLVQASLYELPFRDGVFDGCYCIGVIQHTPDPAKSLQSLPPVLKVGGRIAVTIYERKPATLLYSKYLIRPLTKRLDKRFLLSLLRSFMPVLFVLTEVLFRLPFLGRIFKWTIPVANYVEETELSWRQRYHWALLDTFDMLSPQYDQPQTQQETEEALSSANISNLKRLANPGVNMIGEKK